MSPVPKCYKCGLTFRIKLTESSTGTYAGCPDCGLPIITGESVQSHLYITTETYEELTGVEWVNKG